ncbi:MAG: hypothetical protein KBI45_02900 [Candidatus Saccharicenans sp.]|nr:hypothetical protein [Candidatus Saccharicenans sp.]
MSQKENFKGSVLSTIIPEISYDIIGRISVGSIFLVMTAMDLGYLQIPKGLSINQISSISGSSLVGYLILLAAAGYVIGLILSAMGYPLQKIYFRTVWKQYVGKERIVAACTYLQKISGIGYQDWDELNDKELLRIYTDSHDLLKRSSVYANNLLMKVSGEYLFFQTMAVATLIWYSIHFFTKGFIWWQLLLSIIFSIMMIYFAAERYKRLISRQLSLLLTSGTNNSIVDRVNTL